MADEIAHAASRLPARVALLCVGLHVALLLASPASAAGDTVPYAPVPTIQQAGPESGRRDAIAGAVPLSAVDLSTYRGGETKVAGNQTMRAVTTGNVLNGNYVAGAITLSDNAFSNFNGVGNIAINTGAQVSLQSGMNLTVNVGP